MEYWMTEFVLLKFSNHIFDQNTNFDWNVDQNTSTKSLTSCVSLFVLTVKITFLECRIQAYIYNWSVEFKLIYYYDQVCSKFYKFITEELSAYISLVV